MVAKLAKMSKGSNLLKLIMMHFRVFIIIHPYVCCQFINADLDAFDVILITENV